MCPCACTNANACWVPSVESNVNSDATAMTKVLIPWCY
jgi:hypothetical protein